MEDQYYIPIHSSCLANYFSKAIIVPAKYILKRPEDIQSRFNNSILVSKNKWVKNSDCSIEILLTKAELKDLNILSENFFLYDNPIPISRVKCVYFPDTKQMETTVWNINNGAAFIPKDIIQTEKNKSIDFISEIEITEVNPTILERDLTAELKRFDTILGGFAFMKVGGKSFMNFSEHYFTTLSHFNKLIKEQIRKLAEEKKLTFSDRYFGLFSKNKSEWTKWQKYVYGNVEIKDVEYLAEEQGLQIEKKLGTINIGSIKPDTHLFDIAVLSIYGDNKNKSTDDLVTDISNGIIPYEKAEEISILFGLNNGYSKLRNKYKTRSKEITVKFKMESKLDYYTIESIYQFVFNDEKNNFNFSYLDEWCATKDENEGVKGFETYKILDTVVIAKKKQTFLDIFLEDYSKNIYSKIVDTISQWLPPFAKSEEKEAIKYFERILETTLADAVNDLERKVESEYELHYTSEKSELTAAYDKKIENLKSEIAILIDENNKLKIDIANLRNQNNNLINSDPIKEIPYSESDKKGENESIDNRVKKTERMNEAAESDATPSDGYKKKNVKELKKLAKEKRIKNCNKMKRDELINSLREHDQRFL